MLLPRAALLAALLAAVALPARAFDDKEHKLKDTLKVRDLQGGFAGLTGKQYTIQPSGKWAEYSIRGNNATPTRNGALSKKDLAKLAAEVAKYDPGTLKSTGKAKVNPHVITVTYGKTTAKLTTAGGEMPKPDTDSLEGRFAGILAAVQNALPKVKGKGK